MCKEALEKYADGLRALLAAAGERVDREVLRRTPERAAAMLTGHLSGYREDPVGLLTSSRYPATGPDLVVIRDIQVFSLCEHHLMPFFGRCHIGYIPGAQVTGLSRIPRMVDVLCRRLQMQERLGAEIADAMESALSPAGVGVVIEANHLCMQAGQHPERGSVAVSSVMRGRFLEPAVAQEFTRHLAAPAPVVSRPEDTGATRNGAGV